MKKLILKLTFLNAFVLMQSSATIAHEYWLEPELYSIEKGEPIKGNLKNGQNFKGSTFSYVPNNFEQFSYTLGDTTKDVKGRSGDRPALNQKIEKEGLITVSYQGTFDRITFRDEDKIAHYVEYQALDGVQERHLARGLAKDHFQEQYARCAKALFQVGKVDPQSVDTLTGMNYELVAEKNPYSLTQNDALPVRLYWEGKPIANKQIRMFRFDGDLETLTVRTDKDGRALIPLKGGGKFMLNSVHIFEGDDDPDTKLAEWVSYWASLTFGLADTDEILAQADAEAKSE